MLRRNIKKEEEEIANIDDDKENFKQHDYRHIR